VWQKIAAQRAPDGTASWVTNVAYVELANGLHYWDSGVLKETEEAIVPYSGGAVASQGPHKVIFAPNLATAGAIDMQTADGLRLTSHVVGLSYLDPVSGAVAVIANVKDCAGQIVGGNQVIYSDAFTNLLADVRYTYKRSGIEQDVILREQPPAPETFGMNPDTTVMTVFTEFVNSPVPMVTATPATGDQTPSFGTTRFAPGRAFSMGSGAEQIPVVKKWVVVNGRSYLFEEVPFRRAQQQLQALPQLSSATQRRSKGMVFARVEDMRLPVLPAAREKHPMASIPKARREVQLAMGRTSGASEGFVMDYATIGAAFTNYTFQADTTYYVTGPVSLYGTNYLEGGCVVKFTNYTGLGSLDANIMVYGQMQFKTGPYRPAVFTARDDDNVGEIISGSTGNPSSLYGYAALSFPSAAAPLEVHDIRVSFANYGVLAQGAVGPVTIRDGQFCRNDTAVWADSTTLLCRNLLIHQSSTRAVYGSGSTVSAEHVTIDEANISFDGGTVSVTNSFVVSVTNWPTALACVSSVTNSGNSGLFQTTGAGAHYLAAGSPYRSAGATNINGALQAELQRKTTYPPLVSTNVLYTNATTLSPQVLRDTGATDLGYHYDPVDYLVELFWITNAPLTIAKGTVVASLLDGGGDIWLQDNSAITAAGTADQPVQITFYNTVQEQPLFLSTLARSNLNYAVIITPYHVGVSVPYGAKGVFQFTKFTGLAGTGVPFYHTKANWDFSSLTVENCEFGTFASSGISPGTNTVSVFMNNLFERSVISFQGWKGATLNFTNNLFWGSAHVSFAAVQSTIAAVNNVFDSTTVSGSAVLGGVFSNNFNAYLNCPGTVPMAYAGPNYVIQTNSLAWQTGPLGNYYQPTNSVLIDVGNTNANFIGLYHYTTSTNEVKEGNSTVDLGYHYVAVDANGNPLDTDGDGIPDYLEDVNGDGVYTPGVDIGNWQTPDTFGYGRLDGYFKVFILSPR
jgi:hypothetical protein